MDTYIHNPKTTNSRTFTVYYMGCERGKTFYFTFRLLLGANFAQQQYNLIVLECVVEK